MNLPNRLTVLRIMLIPLILLFLLPLPAGSMTAGWNVFILSYGRIAALVLFSIASLTDLADGRIARKRNLVTTLGKFLDPIADKILVVSVLIALIQTGRLPALIAIIVIIREFVITGLRLIAIDKGIVIAAGKLGKAKTVSQIVAILIVLAEPLLVMVLGSWIPAIWFTRLGDLAMLTAVILTLVSGYQYLRNGLTYLKE